MSAVMMIAACRDGAASDARMPELQLPTQFQEIQQLTAAPFCDGSPLGPYGFQILFDWSDVPGAQSYRLWWGRDPEGTGVGPAIVSPEMGASPPTSQYFLLKCGAYVAEQNRWGWVAYVEAVFPDGSVTRGKKINFQFSPPFP
jgi:hypothetical protein